jgi:hypothetical protein
MRILLLACALLSGCASDCGPDWYQVGQRDGRINAGPQLASYAGRCSPAPDAALYAEGYAAGFAQRPIPNW